MKSLNQPIFKVAVALLVFLWVYASASKLMDFSLFKIQMSRQTLPNWLATLTIWTLPSAELVVAVLLLSNKWKGIGLIMSTVLLGLFTVYIILVLANSFGRIPCACGGVIRALSWKMHLFFNLFFLLLSISGIYLVNRERRAENNQIQ